jgi:hypothetical protein
MGLDPSICFVQPAVPVLRICTGFCFSVLVPLKLIKKKEGNYHQLCINPGCQVTMATTFYMVASNVCDS